MSRTLGPASPPDQARIAWRFDLASFIWAVVLFVLLALLATVGARLGLLRSFFGDVLAVIWVYAGFKAFIRARNWWLACAAWMIGLLVELVQYLSTVFHVRIENPIVRVVLGSTPDWWDVLAYTLGFVAVLVIDAWWTGRRRGRA
ncbi:DUF2809 domain-containing protein [Pigmentiphaga aceris]|uniref:DUF2809 domain-containing protein n=1 Tax=Pigmentiphaga aceris TaxID=1940612 RepID=A0A5C0B1V0_9BURK|nr:DUF2809 domain-containing protein [Pigmentiphaga aceris]QEI08698.1 DUF2809 domain-containing protein [Pigmentiphaga aceris]